PHALAFSPDGRTLAVQDRACVVHLWDTRTRALARSLRLPDEVGAADFPKSVRFSPDGKLLAAAGAVLAPKGGVAVPVLPWAVARGRPEVTLELGGITAPALAFSPDGKTLAVGTPLDPLVQLWDVGTGKRLRGFNPDDFLPDALAFSPDGKVVASCSGERV